MTNTYMEAALAYVASGLSIIPIRCDGSKAPIARWAEYQTRIPTEEEVREWFRVIGQRGIAVIGGKVSGRLEILDFDDPKAWREFHAECNRSAMGCAWDLPQVLTPRGGMHLYYRCPFVIPGNTKLASDAEHHCRIETRGEHGYVLAPPSPIKAHPLGRPYIVAHGTLVDIPEISPMQRAALWVKARMFDEQPPNLQPQPRPSAIDKSGPEPNTVTLLVNAGWTVATVKSDRTLVRRPGRNTGSSGVVFMGTNKLYVNSTSAYPFEAERPYDPWEVSCLLSR